jgi:hypothetical protein
MHLDLNSGIAIDATQAHAMHLALVRPAQRSAAGLAKAQAPSRRRLILGRFSSPLIHKNEPGVTSA